MRKLMWFTIGFAAACVMCAYCFAPAGMFLMSFLSMVAFVLALMILRNRGTGRKMLLLGCMIAFLWSGAYNVLYLSDAKKADDLTMDGVIEITDYSSPTDYGISAKGNIQIHDHTYKIKIYSYILEELRPGDIVRGEVKLHYSENIDWASSLSASGIHLVGYMDDDATVTWQHTIPVKYFAQVLRQKILTLVDTIFPAHAVAFARALLLGDTSLLDYETDTALSVSGIRHVVAVSGLHVSMLFGLVLSLVGFRKVLTPAIGLPILLLFAAVAGFTPSVNRACIMQALMILAMVFDQDYDPPTALSFAVLTMLAVNPLSITSVSFQLSVGCMVGIFLFSAKIQSYLNSKLPKLTTKKRSVLNRMRAWVIGSSSITLSTMVTVTPLCAFYFQTVSLVSILTNLLTLWVVTILFCGIIFTCIAAAVWLPMGKLLAWCLSWLIRYILLVARTLAAIPYSAVYTQNSYIKWWLILCYIFLAVFLLSKHRQPLVLAFCVVTGLAASIVAGWLEPRLDNYRMTVLDVGQGQCILVQWDDKNYVIDCGGDYDAGTADLAAQTLLSNGVRQLDGLILTHYDVDHAASAGYLLSRVPADVLYLPVMEGDDEIKNDLRQKYRDRICWVEPGTVMAPEPGTMTIIAAGNMKGKNETGLYILCQLEKCDILITGDADTTDEKELLERICIPDLEILVAGHHGSPYATGMDLLSATTPEIAIISVGEDNRYRHPSQRTLDRLTMFSCHVLRTDLNGTITIRG